MRAERLSFKSLSPFFASTIRRRVRNSSSRVGRISSFAIASLFPCGARLPAAGLRWAVLCDELRLDPLELGLGQLGKDVPAEGERLVDGPVLVGALVDE